MKIDKKGQSSSIGVIIAIVLGIIVVVFLIWGFSTNWSMFSSTTRGYVGTSNIDDMRQACEVQCANNQATRYCEDKTVILAGGETQRIKCSDERLKGDDFCKQITHEEGDEGVLFPKQNCFSSDDYSRLKAQANLLVAEIKSQEVAALESFDGVVQSLG